MPRGDRSAYRVAVSLPPEVLDRLRRSLSLHMDATGALSIDGEAVTHPRVDRALRAGLDVTDEGEITTAIGTHWSYLTVADCPLRATAVLRPNQPDTAPMLRLDDGRTLPLRPQTLWNEPGRGLRCSVPAARSSRALAVRFTNTAQMDLLPWLVLDEPEGDALVVGARRYPIGAVPPERAAVPT